MNHSFGIVIESLVAVLLMLTIGYCMLLNKRLKRLKADEHSLKATIGELITATEIAERAIGGLKHTVRDVNENLGNQLASATELSQQLKKQLAEGDAVFRRLTRIAIAARPPRRPDRSLSAPKLAPNRSPRRRRRFPNAEGLMASPHETFRDIRVIPVVLVAIFGLAVLKVAGLVIDGGYVFDYQPDFSTEQAFMGAGRPSTSRRRQVGCQRAIPPTSPARSRSRRRKKPPSQPRPRRRPPKPDGAVVYPEQSQTDVRLRARDPGTAAVAAPGTRSARARNRNSREPAESRREAHRKPRSRR